MDPAAKEWTPGSVQGDAFRSHSHDLGNVQRQIYHTGGPPLAGGAGYWHEHGDAPRVLATGGSETRPKNVYVHYLIKL